MLAGRGVIAVSTMTGPVADGSVALGKSGGKDKTSSIQGDSMAEGKTPFHIVGGLEGSGNDDSSWDGTSKEGDGTAEASTGLKCSCGSSGGENASNILSGKPEVSATESGRILASSRLVSGAGPEIVGVLDGCTSPVISSLFGSV